MLKSPVIVAHKYPRYARRQMLRTKGGLYMQTDNRYSRRIGRKVRTNRWCLRRVHVARRLGALAMMVILSTTLLSSTAAAQPQETQIGQLCWQFNPPFTDTLRVAVALLPQASPNDALLFEASVRWRATASAIGQTVGGPGPVTYQLLGAGTFALENAPASPNIDLGFEAVQNTLATPITHFGGNLSCNFFARLDGATLNGSWRVQCPGPTHFTNAGTLTFLAAGCPNADF
jgi:hypothetical protein